MKKSELNVTLVSVQLRKGEIFRSKLQYNKRGWSMTHSKLIEIRPLPHQFQFTSDTFQTINEAQPFSFKMFSDKCAVRPISRTFDTCLML